MGVSIARARQKRELTRNFGGVRRGGSERAESNVCKKIEHPKMLDFGVRGRAVTLLRLLRRRGGAALRSGRRRRVAGSRCAVGSWSAMVAP